MSQLFRRIGRPGALLPSGLARLFEKPRPCGWEVGSARWHYDEVGDSAGIDSTRYGDWEYGGRCTDF